MIFHWFGIAPCSSFQHPHLKSRRFFFCCLVFRRRCRPRRGPSAMHSLSLIVSRPLANVGAVPQSTCTTASISGLSYPYGERRFTAQSYSSSFWIYSLPGYCGRASMSRPNKNSKFHLLLPVFSFYVKFCSAIGKIKHQIRKPTAGPSLMV